MLSDNRGVHSAGKNNLLRYVTVVIIHGRRALFQVRLAAHDCQFLFSVQRNDGSKRIGIYNRALSCRSIAVCIRNRITDRITVSCQFYAFGDVTVIIVNGRITLFLVGSSRKCEISFLREKRENRSLLVRYRDREILGFHFLLVSGRYGQGILPDLVPVHIAADFRNKRDCLFLVHAGCQCGHRNLDALSDREFALLKRNRYAELIVPVLSNSPESRCRNGKTNQGNQHLFHFLPP